MSDTPRVEAVGRDFGRFLPGVFWLNFLAAAGKPHRSLGQVFAAVRSVPVGSFWFDRDAPIDVMRAAFL